MTLELPSTLTSDAVYALAGTTDFLYAARASGLCRSPDGGATWQSAFASLDRSEALTAVSVAALGQTVFAGVKGAVLRSDDSGESWHVAALPSPPPLIGALAISPAFRDDGVVIAGTPEDGVFVSTDRGSTWIPWNFGLIDLAVYTIAVSPDFACDHMVFAGTESGVFRSSSGGRGWKETSFPMDAAPVLSLTLSAGGLLYAGTETHGLFVSDDFGATWHGLKTDAPSTPIHAIHVTTEPAPILFVLLEDSLMWSTDAGSSWRRSQASARFIHSAITMSAHPIDRGSVLVGFASGEIVTFTP